MGLSFLVEVSVVSLDKILLANYQVGRREQQYHVIWLKACAYSLQIVTFVERMTCAKIHDTDFLRVVMQETLHRVGMIRLPLQRVKITKQMAGLRCEPEFAVICPNREIKRILVLTSDRKSVV